MKLEFGSNGPSKKSGFLTVDVRNIPCVDYVCNAWDIGNHVAVTSVSEIYSRHFFEHLTFRQGSLVLHIWKSILKPGGILEIMIPNMDLHIEQFRGLKTNQKAITGFWGWQRGDLLDTWDVHKSGYNLDSLTKVLHTHEYINVESLKGPMHKHLHVTCIKPLEKDTT